VVALEHPKNEKKIVGSSWQVLMRQMNTVNQG
jgi:hypothetical protein